MTPSPKDDLEFKPQVAGGAPNDLGFRPLASALTPRGPKGQQPTDEDWMKTMRGAAEYLPAVGAGVATALAPGVSIPIAMGLAALGGGGGELARQGVDAMAGKPPESIGGSIADVGKEMMFGAAAEGIPRALTAAIAKTAGQYFKPQRLYQSALKPSGTSQITAGRAVQTGLREEIPLNEKSIGVVNKRIRDLQAQVENTILGAPADVPPAQYTATIQKRLDTLRDRWGKDATHGKEFVKQIDDMETGFLLDHGNPKPLTVMVGGKPIALEPQDMPLNVLRSQSSPIPAEELQAIKKQTYETLRTKKTDGGYAPGSHPGLDIKGSQEIASALREDLESLYPEIGKLNRREGALIAFNEQLERFVKREMNKQITPYFVFPAAGALLGGYEGGAGGAGVGAGTGLVAAHFLRSALENPAVKSRLAIVLRKADLATPQAVKAGASAASRVINLPNAVRGTKSMIYADEERNGNQ